MIPAQYDELRRAIPRSRKEATSMSVLAARLDRDEREVRDMVKDLRELYEVPVVALPTRNGVWITDDPAELDGLIRCQQSRLDSLSHSIARLKRVRDRLTYAEALF